MRFLHKKKNHFHFLLLSTHPTNFMLYQTIKRKTRQDVYTINDPLGQTQIPANSDHYSHLKFVLSRKILKSPDGRPDRYHVLK